MTDFQSSGKSTDVPTRRTLIVFVALIGSMTAVSALLLWLQPVPLQTRKVPRLSATHETATASQAIFRTEQMLHTQRWPSIVIS